jgi:tRNA threonylcarbamoyladenosine biosynthesis protein TsaE
MPTNQINLADEQATLEFGARLARASFLYRDKLYPDKENPAAEAGQGVPTLGGIIYLHGDLGAGKTTLTRGLMRGYGYEGAVKSPTYTLVEPYEFGQCNIYHFDLYRLADPEEVEYLGIDDYFSPSNLCLIEWAEQGKGLLPPADLDIEISIDGTARLLSCQSLSEKGERIAQRLWV